MNVSPRNRQRLLIACALGFLAVYAIMSVMGVSNAMLELDRARIDLVEVNRKLDQIDLLKQAPRVAALQLESPAEISQRVAAARRAAGLPQASLLKQQPLDPQRIQRSDFEQRSTIVELAPSSLAEILAFCDAIRDAENGTIVRDLTLSEPTSGASGGNQEKWEATLTLTQIIFSPTSR